MLRPDDRHTLVDALAPPDGYVLSNAVATTYSLDLDALLMVPAHLALSAVRDDDRALEDRLGLLAALRRAASLLTVYHQAGRICEPSHGHELYGLLESVVVPATSPRAGEFHAKMWLLAFREERGADVRMRLLVQSRNLTFDRSWDVSLRLEGAVQKRGVAVSKPLGEFVAALPALARQPLAESHRRRADELAELARRVDWELPPGFRRLAFHPIGLGGRPKPWRPDDSDRLVVISPFVSAGALAVLAKSTREPVALISRGEELDKLTGSAPFARALMLDDRAETEDGEEAGSANLVGLHAKVYVAKHGWDTRIYLGSANATSAALGPEGKPQLNVELLVELEGRSSAVGGIDAMLDEDGLGPLLREWQRSDVSPEDASVVAADEALEAARAALARVALRVRYERAGELWTPTVVVDEPIPLPEIDGARGWLASMQEGAAVDLAPLKTGAAVRLPSCDLASATGFVVFELRVDAADRRLRFTLPLPVDGLDADRDTAIVRNLVRDPGRFLAYVLALLGMDGAASVAVHGVGGTPPSGAGKGEVLGAGLLERLVRAKSRDPGALSEIGRLIDDLVKADPEQQIVPPDFLHVWEIFRQVEAQ